MQVATKSQSISRSDIPCMATPSEQWPEFLSGAVYGRLGRDGHCPLHLRQQATTRQAIQEQQPMVDPKRESDCWGIAGPFEPVVAPSPTIRRDSIHGRQ